MLSSFNNIKSEISCDFAKSTLKNWENIAIVADSTLAESVKILKNWGCQVKCLENLSYLNIKTELPKCGCPEPIHVRTENSHFDYKQHPSNSTTISHGTHDKSQSLFINNSLKWFHKKRKPLTWMQIVNKSINDYAYWMC